MAKKTQAFPDRYLDLREAAAFLGVHYKTLTDWSNRRLISYVKLPGQSARRRFRLSDLEAFMARHKVPELKGVS